MLVVTAVAAQPREGHAQVRLDTLAKPMPAALPKLAGLAPIESDRGDPTYCTAAAWDLAAPLKMALRRAVDQIEATRQDGEFPQAINFPVDRATRVSFSYHRTHNSYAVGIGSIHESSAQYVAALHDIMACSTVYVGSDREIRALGMYGPPADPKAPFLYYSPQLGLYDSTH